MDFVVFGHLPDGCVARPIALTPAFCLLPSTTTLTRLLSQHSYSAPSLHDAEQKKCLRLPASSATLILPKPIVRHFGVIKVAWVPIQVPRTMTHATAPPQAWTCCIGILKAWIVLSTRARSTLRRDAITIGVQRAAPHTLDMADLRRTSQRLAAVRASPVPVELTERIEALRTCKQSEDSERVALRATLHALEDKHLAAVSAARRSAEDRAAACRAADSARTMRDDCAARCADVAARLADVQQRRAQNASQHASLCVSLAASTSAAQQRTHELNMALGSLRARVELLRSDVERRRAWSSQDTLISSVPDLVTEDSPSHLLPSNLLAGDGDDASEETEIGVPPPLPDAQAPDVPASFAHDLRHVPPHGRRRNTPPLNPQAKAFTMRENFSHAHASPAYLHVLPEFSPWMPSPWNPAPRTRQPWV